MLMPMSFFNRRAAVMASTLLIAVLSACSGGDGPDSDYCKDLDAGSATLQSLKTGDSQLFDAFELAHRLQAEAPDDVKDAWTLYDGAMKDIQAAFKHAGIGPKEFEQLKRGEVPAGVDQEELRGFPARFQKLDGPEFKKATKTIGKHAEDVCDVRFKF